MTVSLDNVLVVVAHPDDEVLGCGATISKALRDGGRVRILILGEGSSCRFPGDAIGSEEVRRAIEQRRSLADAALRILGAGDVVFGDLPCGRFDTVPIIDIGKRIEAQIDDFRPTTVITHWSGDAHADHRLTLDAVNVATRPVAGGCVKHVLSCEILSSTEWRFVETFSPTCFVDVSDHLEVKIAAFVSYMPTEGRPFPFPRCEEGLRVLARYRGMQAGLHHAEAFQVVRSVISDA